MNLPTKSKGLMRLFSFAIFFIFSSMFVLATPIQEFYVYSFINGTNEGGGGVTVKHPHPHIMNYVETVTYSDRLPKFIYILFNQTITIQNESLIVSVGSCDYYAWDEYSLYYETDVLTVDLGTWTDQDSLCNSTGYQRIMIPTVTTDDLIIKLVETNTSQDWGYGTHYYSAIKEIFSENDTALPTYIDEEVDYTTLTNETRLYTNAIVDGDEKFNQIFYIVLFLFFIFLMFKLRQADLSLTITGFVGIVASYLLSGNFVQMLSAGALLALGLTILLIRGFT